MSLAITNSIALVTGANRGIGRSIVEALLARGAAKVYAAARNPASLASLVAAHGDRVVPLTLDVTSAEQVTAAVAAAADATLIINNAGVIANPDLFAAELDGARQEFEVNYWGTLAMIRAFTPSLKAHGGGTFVNLSSIAGLTNFPMFPTYSDAKAAVHSLTVGARLLLGAANIKFLGVRSKPTWPKTSISRKPLAPMSPPRSSMASNPGPKRCSPMPWLRATPAPTRQATKRSNTASSP
jgi:NAD(P)-dependent dehydrogenase (short-subunit alcohol dehydrogenase family)